MVDPIKVRDLLRQRPFKPFRVYLTDGRVFDIRFPQINMVTKHFFEIGIPMPNDPDPVWEKLISIAWDSISKIEPLDAALPASSCESAKRE